MDNGTLRVAVVNWHFGGIDPETGDKAAWSKTVAALRDMEPDIVLCQEISARHLRQHLWETANQLCMTPILGGPTPQSVSGNHPAILVDSDAQIEVHDEGPTVWPSGGGTRPAWREARLRVPGLKRALRVYSVHMPTRSAQAQLEQAQRLASYVGQRGEYAIVGGDFNCYAPADKLTADDLAQQPLHLRPPRMRRGRNGDLACNFDVHDTLTTIGMSDVAAMLLPEHREPAELTPTAAHGRIDRVYVGPGMGPAVCSYVQRDTGGSDHQAVMVTLDLRQVTNLPPGPFE